MRLSDSCNNKKPIAHKRTSTTAASPPASAPTRLKQHRVSSIAILPSPSPPASGPAIRTRRNIVSTSLTSSALLRPPRQLAPPKDNKKQPQPTQPSLLSRHSKTISFANNFTTNNTTSATSTARRPPLRSQHHNNRHGSSLALKPSSSCASISNMPPGDRPRQPQLSAASARINRTPLTPKIATKGPPVTPLARRPQSSTPILANGQTTRDDVPTPVNAFLANTITPRSGPRQNRVDSATSTPNGTPNLDRTSDGWDHNSNRTALGISSYPYEPAARQAASQVELVSDSNDSNKFFYASDAKSIQQAALQRPSSVPQKTANPFCYANGMTPEVRRNISPPSNSTVPTPVNPSTESVASKFIYANGAPDVSLRPSPVPSGSASVVSSASRLASSRPPTANSSIGPGLPAQRPASPIKSVSVPMAQTLRSTAGSPTSPRGTPPVASPPLFSRQSSSVSQRKVSIDAAPKIMGGHARSGSVSAIDPLRLPNSNLSSSPSETVSMASPLSPELSQPVMTMASILQTAEDSRDGSELKDGDDLPEVHSPTKSTHLSDSISELVANARRERKVQDLEITNASLEAINRTLERQLRKQTMELRRYRRLSRSGVLSTASSRVTSLAMTEPPTDMSEVDDEDETGLEDEYDLDSMDDSDISSNDSLSTEDILMPNKRLEARRRRDEKRLQLDLTKHQELLIDSQKMNQSLKRCQDLAESLIKEGQKALEYHVRVSDIALGGRVLAPPDEDEDERSSLEEEMVTHNEDSNLELPHPKSSQDRDSGVELPTDGS